MNAREMDVVAALEALHRARGDGKIGELGGLGRDLAVFGGVDLLLESLHLGDEILFFFTVRSASLLAFLPFFISCLTTILFLNRIHCFFFKARRGGH